MASLEKSNTTNIPVVDQLTEVLVDELTKDEIDNILIDAEFQRGYFDHDVVDYDVLEHYSPIITPIFLISIVILVFVSI